MDINTFYLVEGASPYEKIKEVSVAHSFITVENEHEQISVYEELEEAFSDEKNVFYKRTYTFSNQKIDLLENLDNSEDVKLLVNEVEIDLADQVKVNRSALLNQRYENLGFVFVEENKEKSERLLIVEFNTVTWNVSSIDEAGNIETRQEITEKVLDKDKYLVKVLKESTLGPAYYKSSILMGYPSFYFPVLYPFITVILAIILILYGSFSLKKKKVF